MALVQDEKEFWAWVDSPEEKPEKFYPTKDEALQNAPKIQGKPATMDSVGDREGAYTVTSGKWF